MSVMCNNPNGNGVYCNQDAGHLGMHSGWHAAGYRTYWDENMTADVVTTDYMCPNCVTPWKCNGPHDESHPTAEELSPTPAVTIGKYVWPDDTFQGVFADIFTEAFDLLVERQKKYGPENIRSQGIFGVFTRLKNDKIERLKRAMNGRVEHGEIVLDTDMADFGDESFEDALLDIANYSLIILALKRGVWGKPLA